MKKYYRVVKFGGMFDDTYHELKEVFYNRDGSLAGSCDAIVGAETVEELVALLDQMKADAHRAVVDEEELYRVDTKREELFDDD